MTTSDQVRLRLAGMRYVRIRPALPKPVVGPPLAPQQKTNIVDPKTLTLESLDSLNVKELFSVVSVLPSLRSYGVKTPGANSPRAYMVAWIACHIAPNSDQARSLIPEKPETVGVPKKRFPSLTERPLSRAAEERAAWILENVDRYELWRRVKRHCLRVWMQKPSYTNTDNTSMARYLARFEIDGEWGCDE